LRGVFHKRRILSGIKSKNKADGPIDNIVSSKRRVKSKVERPGISRKGPKLLSLVYAVELRAPNSKNGKLPLVFMIEEERQI
jgi:hypothetical protein